MIDFPQMVSIDHPNAEFYFSRDVECIRTFFRKKLNFEGAEFPKFDEISRKHNLDIELEASGFTKSMAMDLNRAYDEGNFDAHLKDYQEEEDEEEKECRRERLKKLAKQREEEVSLRS